MAKLKQDKGFTLIELLVALAIVGIILLAFFTSINSTIRMDAKNDRDIKALNLAQSEIENLRNQIKTNVGSENQEINQIIQSKENISNRIIEPYKKTIDGKEFEISLYNISKSKLDTQNTNLDEELYMYTINIKVKSLDTYFSGKITELNNIKILSKNS